MAFSRYHKLSIVSGAVWGGIAIPYALLYKLNVPWAAVLVSPVIGLLIGVVQRPFLHRAAAIRYAVAVLSVLLAVALFGLAHGAWMAIAGVSLDGSEVTTRQPGAFFVAYVFAMTVVVSPLLWPLFALGVFNTSWLAEEWRRETNGSPAGV